MLNCELRRIPGKGAALRLEHSFTGPFIENQFSVIHVAACKNPVESTVFGREANVIVADRSMEKHV